MPTTPVLVQTWLDPPLQSDFLVGQSVTWHASFIDRISRQVVDPDIVTFSYENPPVSTAVSQTYPASIVKDGVGLYHWDLPAFTGKGRWVLNVTAQGNPGAVGTGQATLTLTVYGAGI